MSLAKADAKPTHIAAAIKDALVLLDILDIDGNPTEFGVSLDGGGSLTLATEDGQYFKITVTPISTATT